MNRPTGASPSRRETTTHRVELVVPSPLGDGSVSLSAVLAARDELERERPRTAEPVVIRHVDGEVRVSYDVTLTPGDPVRQLLRHASDLCAALDVDPLRYTSWTRLLQLVRRQREALERLLPRRDAPDEPVLVWLPRDWPRRLDALLADAGNKLGLVTSVKRLVDDWVLAALDRFGEADQHDVLGDVADDTDTEEENRG